MCDPTAAGMLESDRLYRKQISNDRQYQCPGREVAEEHLLNPLRSGNIFVSGCKFVTIYCLDFLFFPWAISLVHPYFSCLPKTRSHLFLQVYADLHRSKKFLFHLHFGHKKDKNISQIVEILPSAIKNNYVFWFQMYQQRQILVDTFSPQKGEFHLRGTYNR